MTLCKFEVYILNDQQKHWVQCALPINIYIEKMYLIIFVWLLFLFVLMICSIFYNLFFILNRKKFIFSEINSEKIDDSTVHELSDFLKPDGVLVLSILKRIPINILLTTF